MSHRGTAIKPVRILIQEPSKEVHFCGCKLSKNGVFCDGYTCVKLRGDDTSERKELRTEIFERQRRESGTQTQKEAIESPKEAN